MPEDDRSLMPVVPPGEPEGPWRTLAQFAWEAVQDFFFSVLLLGSMAGAFFGSQLAYRSSPAATWAVGVVLAALLVYGGWIRTTPEQGRGRFGRFAAKAAGAVGIWLVACLIVAPFELFLA